MSVALTRGTLRGLTSKSRSFIDRVKAGPAPSDPLAILYRRGHVAVTKEGSWAFYALAPVDWTGRHAVDHDAVITAGAHRVTEQTGHRILLRGTAEPFPVEQYLDALDGQAPNRPADVDVPGARTWEQLKAAAAVCMTAHNAARSRTYVGVRFTHTTIPRHLLPEVVGDELVRIHHGNAAPLRRDLADTDDAVARAGWEATPLTETQLSWLITRSLHTGTDPAVVDADAPADAERTPRAPTTVLHPVIDGISRERHVRVLTLTQPEDRDTHERFPWMAYLSARGAEWAACYDVFAGEDLVKPVGLRADIVQNLVAYGEDLDERVDRGLGRAAERAEEVLDEVSTGSPTVAVRGMGQVIVAVTGETEDEAVKAAKTLTADVKQHQGMVPIARGDQYAAWRRLIPGEPWGRMLDDRTRQPSRFIASGVPGASQAWGDSVGMPVGPVYGSQIDVGVFDTHGFNEHEKPGGLLIGARQGGAKTSLAVQIADWELAQGHSGTAFSPDGQIARIGEARHVKPHFRHFPLTQQRRRGILQPSLLIPEPSWEHYTDDPDPVAALASATEQAVTARITRTVDALVGLLPYELTAANRGARSAVKVAVTESGGGEYGVDPWEHVEQLRAHGGEVGREVAALITASEHDLAGRLTLPDRRAGADPEVLKLINFSGALFTCITCPDAELPQTPDPAGWTDKQQQSVQIMAGGAYLSARSVRADRNPGWWLGDEIDIATGGVGPMGAFLMALLYDIRRFNKLAMMLVKTGTAFKRIDPHATSLFGSVAVGPMMAGAADDFIPALGVPTGQGWEETIERQRTGEWVWRDWSGRVRPLRVENGWLHPDLKDATYTTPAEATPALVTAGGSW